jgi:polyferredoxin
LVPQEKLLKNKHFRHWTAIRKVVQTVFLLAIIVILIYTRNSGLNPEESNFFLRIDPLTVIAQAISSRSFLSGSIAVLATLLLTLVVGRAWCGWICPVGTTLDIFSLRKRSKREATKWPEAWRKIKYLLLIAILISAIFSNLTLLIFDPITIFIRTFTTSIWPGIDRAFTTFELTLYPISFLQEPLSKLDNLLRPSLLPISPSVYRLGLLYGLIFLGLVGLNLLAPRFWCRYFCPLGGLLGWISKISLFRRKVNQASCKDCPMCTRACPTGTINPEKGYISDPSECTVCMDCQDSCRLGSTSWNLTKTPSQWNQYDPSRRETLALFGVTAGTLAIASVEPDHLQQHPALIQPPGAQQNNLFEKCIRCGECMRTCPTSALQPAVFEGGYEGMGTPILIPRLGACDYSCNACGQVCPVEAIPPLPLEEKRLAVIGKAYIDQNRCVAWSDHRDCIVCEEMCPLPEKAIYLVPTDVTVQDNQVVRVKLPNVLRDKCIGCGICEYKCPVTSTAAIRVYKTS